MERIKCLISLKPVAYHVPPILSLDDGDTIINPYDFVNTFNNYFASIAETTKKSINYSHSSDYLSNEIFLVQYFYNLLIKKKLLTSYPLSTPVRLQVQTVYLTEYYF